MMRLGLATIASVAIALSLVVAAPQVESSIAASASDFDPGYIISDANFYHGSAMTQAQIQQFLDANIGTCENANCLNILRQNTPNLAANAQCAAYAGVANELASAVIFKVQAACRISAKVILVTLQKEQSLVTHKAPTAGRLQAAMGMGCPDTAACDSQYYGFFNQVYAASRQFNRYNTGSFTWFPVGRATAVQFHPNAACGAAPVSIQNRATAALYYYTPYQPNAAALANLYGTGDACSSYGNRNFWRMYTDWFGSPIGLVNPIGSLDSAVGVAGGVNVFGWAFDPDSTDPIAIHVYVNGAYNSSITANKTRTDLAAVYPGRTQHGFSDLIPLSHGSRSVCLYAINVVHGSINTPLGCRTVVVPTPPPVEPPANESAAVYRFWSDVYNGHFYTRSVAERNNIIAKYPGVWKYETVAFGAFGTAVEGTVPVYRFWSTTYNGHFYTTSEAEKNQIIATYPAHIWKYETVAFYVYPSNSAVPGTVPMSRFWSAAYGHHFYTSSEAEAQNVRARYPHIWAYEGQVFRVPGAKPAAAPLP